MCVLPKSVLPINPTAVACLILHQKEGMFSAPVCLNKFQVFSFVHIYLIPQRLRQEMEEVSHQQSQHEHSFKV